MQPYEAHLTNFLAFSLSASDLGSWYGMPQHKQPVDPVKHNLRHVRRYGALAVYTINASVVVVTAAEKNNSNSTRYLHILAKAARKTQTAYEYLILAKISLLHNL